MLSSNGSIIGYSTQDETKLFIVSSDLSLNKAHTMEPCNQMIIKDKHLYYINLKNELMLLNLVSLGKI